MKKSILCIIFACCNIVFLHASENQYLGVQVGFTQPITRVNSPISGSETTLNATVYNGVKVGLVYDATIIKGFGYTMGLNYTFGGGHTPWVRQTTTQPGDYPKIRTRGQYHQLELLVDWQYKFEIAKDTWLLLYTGPTIQCGLSLSSNGYRQPNATTEEPTFSKNLYDETSAKDYTLKRINVTWGIGVGFQYDRYFIRGGYDFGLINPYKAQMFESKNIYTRGRFDQWQIKLGVYFWKK